MSHEKIASTFDDWAARGRDEGMERGHGDVVEQVVEQLGVRAGEKILDLGCGNGWATRMLAKSAAGAQAVGIDVSPRMVARAEELHSLTIRARYEVCPFEALDFKDGEFDRAFSMEALYYATDLDGALAEVLRVLKPGGNVDIVLDFYRERPATERWQSDMDLGMHYMGEAEWRSRFEATGFTGVTTARVVDRRGPGDESGFEPDECYPDWQSKVQECAAGSLWIHARKPK